MNSIIYTLVLMILIVATSVKRIKPYERGVIFRMGAYFKTIHPGFHLIIPILDRLQKVDLKKQSMSFEPQNVKVSGVDFPIRTITLQYKIRADDESVKDSVLQTMDVHSDIKSVSYSLLKHGIKRTDGQSLLEKTDAELHIKQILQTSAGNYWGLDILDVRLDDTNRSTSTRYNTLTEPAM